MIQLRDVINAVGVEVQCPQCQEQGLKCILVMHVEERARSANRNLNKSKPILGMECKVFWSGMHIVTHLVEIILVIHIVRPLT